MKLHLRATERHLPYGLWITGSHSVSVTFHPTQVNPTLARQVGTRGMVEGWVACMHDPGDGLPAHRRSPIQVPGRTNPVHYSRESNYASNNIVDHTSDAMTTSTILVPSHLGMILGLSVMSHNMTSCIGLFCYCLSNALQRPSSIGQNIKSLGVSGLRSPMSGQSVKNFKWP